MLGSRIKQGRVAAGLSLRDVAEAVGLSAMAISKYERDVIKPSSETLLRLAKAFGVRTEYFFRQPAVELTEVDFRKHEKLSPQDEARALEDVRERLERWIELESVIPAIFLLVAVKVLQGMSLPGLADGFRPLLGFMALALMLKLMWLATQAYLKDRAALLRF